jgi:hypothetical protein
MPVGPSAFGVWGGSTPPEQNATVHLPMATRISTLLLWAESDVVSPHAPAKPHEIIPAD